MSKTEFNLLREPWIRVMRPDGRIEEVSVLGLFRQAPEYRGLAGELPTQDVAVLRFLLAILYAVFDRYDLDGNSAPLWDKEAALHRWQQLWARGAFPMGIVEEYLHYYEERFYLFHPEYPFYQIAELGTAAEYTAYSAAKLNGELSESANKARLFPSRSGNEKSVLGYPAAARWLFHANAFDDTSAKPKTEAKEAGRESPGAGWLGKLGLIFAVGDNLFDTLLLNLVLAKDNYEDGQGQRITEKPVWEKPVATGERTRIAIPDNQAELLTLQSRRLLLERDATAETVTGYRLLGGDFFDPENAFLEKMTVWREKPQTGKVPAPIVIPRRHDPRRQIWRDFGVLVELRTQHGRPGIVNWIADLRDKTTINRPLTRFQIVIAKYGDKDFVMDDILEDTLSFNTTLLTELAEDWVSFIIEELANTERLVEMVGRLAQNLAKASGYANDQERKSAAKEQAYFMLDIPFRQWLEAISVADDKEKRGEEWWKQAQKTIRFLGSDLIDQVGPQAFVGRVRNEKNKLVSYRAAESYNYFIYKTSSREALKEGKKS